MFFSLLRKGCTLRHPTAPQTKILLTVTVTRITPQHSCHDKIRKQSSPVLLFFWLKNPVRIQYNERDRPFVFRHFRGTIDFVFCVAFVGRSQQQQQQHRHQHRHRIYTSFEGGTLLAIWETSTIWLPSPGDGAYEYAIVGRTFFFGRTRRQIKVTIFPRSRYERRGLVPFLDPLRDTYHLLQYYFGRIVRYR